MKFTLIFVVLLLSATSSLLAQLGINGSYRFTNAPEWNILDLSNNRTTELPGTGWSAGLEYAFALRNTRLEFVPELNATQFQADVLDLGDLDASFYSLFMHVRAYILDLKGDCQCPTFSKNGNTFTKGLYVELSPGFSYIFSNIYTDAVRYKGRSTHPSLGLGAGLDFGVSKKLTLTPFGALRYTPEAIWPGLEESIERDLSIGDRQVSNYSPLTQVYLGMRVRVQVRK